MTSLLPALALALVQSLALQPPAPPGDSAATRWVATQPDRARDSIRTWMASSISSGNPGALLARADRIASAYLLVWNDSFPLRDLRRFARLPAADRVKRVRADSLRRAGNTALGGAGFAAAARSWRASHALALAIGDTAVMASALGNLGAGFYRESLLDSAARYFEAARTLAGLAGDRRTELNALGGLASVSKDRGNYVNAARQYREALQLRRQVGDYRGVAADADNLGLIAAATGNVAEARRRYLEALVTAREHGFADAAATALLNLGSLASSEGDERAAEARYREALALYRTVESPADEALVFRNLGLLNAGRGDYPAAAADYHDAVTILEQTGPVEVLVGTQVDLSQVYSAMGRLEEAERALGAAERAARSGGLSLSTSGMLELARGDLVLDFNRVDPARKHYQGGLALLRQANDRRGEADAVAALGGLELIAEDYATARQLLGSAASLQRSTGDARAAAMTDLLAARAAEALGDSADARRRLLAAVDTLRASGDRVGHASALCELGTLHRARGALRQAEAAYREGLTRLGRTPAIGAAVCLRSGLGQALAARGATRDAIAAIEAGIREIETSASGVSTIGRRSDFLSDKWDLYTDLALVHAARGEDALAFDASERLRARQTLSLVTLPPASRAAPGGHPRVAALRRRITALLDASRTHATALALRGPDDPVPLPDRRVALAQAEAEYSELLDSLETVGAPAPSAVSGTGWREIAAQLSGDAALIEYLVTDSSALAFVIRRDRLATVRLAVTGAELASEVDFVRGLLTPGAAPGPGTPWAAPLRRLHRQLITPIEEAGLLRGAERLLIVPHRELHYLPFPALLDPGPAGQFLAERYQLAEVASGAVWLRLRARPGQRTGQRILALAPQPGDLPGTRAEVQAIGALYGSDARVVIGARATRQLFTSAAPGHAILHLASRGVLNRRNPRFSYVALAAEGGSDGRLEVHEVSRLSLDATLVVLSACQTGLGSGRVADVPPGDDWVGLVQAFQSAGARSVLATLWPVDDQATAGVIGEFYRALRHGASETAALASAQRSTIAKGRSRSPFYWAGFVLNGGM